MDEIASIGDKAYELVSLYGLRVIGALVIFVVGKRLARFAASLTRRAMERAGTDATLIAFLSNSAK